MAGDKQQEAIEQVAKEGASLATVFKAAVKEIQ
jgi:hypothetical protein